MSTPAIRAALKQLTLASKLLVAAILVYALYFVPRSVADPNLVFQIVWFFSSGLCILGFAIANAHIGMTGAISDFTQPRLPIDRLTEFKTRLSIVLMFYLSFLIPFLNILIAVWAYFRIRFVVKSQEKKIADDRATAARRHSKFGAMGS